MNTFKKQKIISFYVNIITITEFIESIKNFLLLKKGHYICVSNVHQCIEAYKDNKFAKVINNADLAIPDGRPIYWALKLLNHKKTEHLPGYDITKALCEFASKNHLKVGFYGGDPQSLQKCVKVLNNEFKQLEIDYAYSPPFRKLDNNEKKKIIENINKSEIQLLFVCLGCPKQEYWIAEHKKYFKCTSIGIGEVVDLISKKTSLTPKWIQNIGLRWLFRLMAEPKRLFWRYFSTNLKFIYLFFKQYLKFKLYKNIN